MKKITISFKITEAQFHHFEKRMEIEGCESVTAMFRKAGFLRWPMPKSHESIKQSLSDNSAITKQSLSDDSAITKQSLSNHLVQAPNQESFPHTPFKEYNNISNACAREEKPKKPKSAEPKFVPPTLDEVREYIAAKAYTFDAEHFWSFYTAKGWRVGSTVMKSWHAACTTWQKNSDQRNKTEAIRQAHYDARFEKQKAAASANNNSRYHNGRLKLSNHVDISEEERNDLLKDFFA